MLVLALDTSTATGGVALVEDGRLLGEYVLDVQRTTHSERLLPAVERVLQDAGLGPGRRPDGVAVALGPGSFTGLRIGVMTAKAFSYAWRVPVVGVLTLEALAYQASGATPLACPIMDARNGNVFTGLYDVRGPEPVAVAAPALRPARDWFGKLADGRWREEAAAATPAGMEGDWMNGAVMFCGDGVPLYWDDIVQALGERARRPAPGFELLRTGAVAMLGAARLARGERDDPMRLAPAYLRESEAERKWGARSRRPSPS
ncbi:MAG: tRNA (adenosine(37)-N6)-threonylcarbamoyltransferase complex dimerization subunit type 1 TsaB [Limnochordales bacterium]